MVGLAAKLIIGGVLTLTGNADIIHELPLMAEVTYRYLPIVTANVGGCIALGKMKRWTRKYEGAEGHDETGQFGVRLDRLAEDAAYALALTALPVFSETAADPIPSDP